MNDCVTRDEFNNIIQSFHNLFLTKEAAEKIYIKDLDYKKYIENLNKQYQLYNNQQNENLKIIKKILENNKKQTYGHLFSLCNLFEKNNMNKENINLELTIKDPSSFLLNDFQFMEDLVTLITNYYNGRMLFIFTDAHTIYENMTYFIIDPAQLDKANYFYPININVNTNKFDIILINSFIQNIKIQINYYLLSYNYIDNKLIFKIIKKDEIQI